MNTNQSGYQNYNYNATPNLPYGGGAPMNNNYGYRNMNWGSYQMTTYVMNKMYLDQYIPSIFQRWDSNRTGTIEMHEFPGMCTELFRCMNMPAPSQNDMWYLMWKFDQDKNGKIDYYEWANMVYTLGGLKK
jgi:hypothetical protein